MPVISISAISMADMSWLIVSAEAELPACIWPVQMTRPPGPGMNPNGVSARLPNVTSSNAASTGFLAHLIAVRVLT